MATILLTGATGYIASHTWLALQSAGYSVVGVDDFSNSSPEVLNRIQELGGQRPVFAQADVNDGAALDAVFAAHRIDAVVHFAACKAVGESAAEPLKYYANNLGGLVSVCQAMQRHGVKHFVFSSSATVYGEPQFLPYTEAHPLAAMNVYGRTKLYGEQVLRDLEASDPTWNIAWLRYFNPVGAHESGRMGEYPRGVPNNLMPYVQQVAVGRREFLSVYGGDYDTPDGTGVRDYLHVMDLAEGHVAAVRYLLNEKKSVTVNLGTGVGVSVLDLVKAFERAAGKPIAYKIVDRRPGDLPAYYADATLAKALLGWSAKRDIDQMCADSWRWQSGNPNGY
ncbi:MAG: UDP-glucose 4-epimerase GalE [Vitreoscilla sp.]|nr:UDP-glucose 4-epimerase GalE [Vitreoscilla sp.]